MGPLRILHLVANRWWTGSADPALDLARALRARGHQVWFGCIAGDALEAHAAAAGFAPLPRPRLERTADPRVLLGDLLALRRLVRTRRVQIVHCHLTHDHWLAALASTGLGVRLVRTVHHRRALRPRPLTRWLLRRTDALLAPSEGIARAAEARGARPGTVHRVPGAVDLHRFAPGTDGSAIRQELGLGPGPVVGAVGRMVPGRGHDVLVRAVARLVPLLPELRLVLVGRGEGRPAVEALARQLGLERVVRFAGYRGEDLPTVLAALDCFVQLGAGSEESCRAVLEAMAMRLPVVAARVGALPETVVEGETGFLVDRDPEAVAAAVARVLADPARARAMGQAGRRRVEAHFTSERRAERVEGIYRELLPSTAC